MATDDRKVQLGVTVDATEARKGFSDVKDSARGMAQSVTEQGAKAGKAVDSIGSGGAASAQKVDAATRSMIQSIQRTTAAMEAGSKSSSDYYQALAQQRGIPTDALAPYLAALDAARAKQDAAAESMGGVDLASQRFMQSLQSQAAALKDQVATFGMNKTELLAYQAAQMRAGEAATSLISEIARQEAALKALRDSSAGASVAVGAFSETEAEAEARIKSMVASSREAQAQMDAAASATKSAAASNSAFGASAEEMRATIAAQNAAMSGTARGMTSLDAQMAALTTGMAQGSASFRDLEAQFGRLDLLMANGRMSTEEFEAAQASLWKNEDRLLAQTNALVDRYDTLGVATRKLASDEAMLEDAYKNGQVTTAQYQKTMSGIAADQASVQLRNLAQQEAQLEQQLKSGQISLANYKKELAGIGAQKADFSALVAQVNGASAATTHLGGTTAYARTEMLRLANDIAIGNFGRFEQTAMVLAEQFDMLGKLASPLGIAIGGVTAAIALSAVTAGHAAESMALYGESLTKLSQQTGISTDELQKIGYGLETVGGKSAESGVALDALAKKISDARAGSKDAQATFQALGISLSDLKKLSMDQVLGRIADKFSQTADDAGKFSVAEQLFGSASKDMIAYLDRGSAGLAELGAQAQNVGAVLDQSTIAQMNRLGEELNTIHANMDAVSTNAKTAFLPVLETISSALVDVSADGSAVGTAFSVMSGVVAGSAAVIATAVMPLKVAAQSIVTTWEVVSKAATGDMAGAKNALISGWQEEMDAAKKYADFMKNLFNPQSVGGDGLDFGTGGGWDGKISPQKPGGGTQSHADSVSNRDVANLKAEIAAQEQQLALLDQYNTTNAKITEGDKRVLQIEQQLGLAQKDRIGKVTDAQLKEQLGYAQTLASLEHEVQARKNAADATKAYNNALDKWADSEQNALDALGEERSLVDQGAESQKLMQIQLQAVADAKALILKQQKDGKPLSEEERQNLLALAAAHGKNMAAIMGESDAVKAARQLQDQNERFAAESIADERQRNDALVALDAKKWQDVIKNAGEGTEAQKKLIEQYDQWLSNQYNKPIVDEWKKTIDGIGTDFHDGFLQMLTNGKSGWDSFTKSLKNTFETAVVDEIYREFAKPFIVNVVAQIAGVVSGQSVQNALLGQQGSGSGITNLLSNPYGTYNNLSNAYNTVAGWIQGYGGASTALGSSAIAGATGSALASGGVTLGGLGAGMSADVAASSVAAAQAANVGANTFGFTAAGAGSSGGSLASMGAGAMYGGAGLLGGLAGGALFGNKGYSSLGGSLGAMGGLAIGASTAVAGTAMGAALGSWAGPIGAVIGAALGALVGSFIGGGETRYGSVYTSDGTNDTKVSAPSGGDPAADQVTQQINSTYQTIQSMASQLGGSIDGLGTYTAGYEISPKKGNSFVVAGFQDDPNQNGTGHQDLKGVKDSQTVLDDFSLQLQRSIIDSLQKAHLDAPYADLLQGVDASKLSTSDITALVNELNTLKTLFDSFQNLGSAFDNLKNAGTTAQYNLINLAGGVDNLNSELSYFNQNFTSTAEQTAAQAKGVTDQLAALGESGIATKDQYRAVVESIDLTTDSGQKLYQQMLALAPAFDQMTQAAQQAADAQQSLWNNYFSAVYTSDQQAAMAQKQLQAQFDALGVAMPATNAAFEALVENMDTSTQPAKDLQNALLALAPTFAQVTQAVQQAQANIGAAQKAAISTLSSSAQSLYTARANASSLLDSINASITGSDVDTSAQISALWSEMTGGGVSLTQQIDLATQLNGLITKRYETEQQAMSTLTQQGRQLLSYVQGLKIGDLSTETPGEKLADAAQQYADTLAKAQGGD